MPWRYESRDEREDRIAAERQAEKAERQAEKAEQQQAPQPAQTETAEDK